MEGNVSHLELLLGQLKVEGVKVALDVGHTCGLGDDTGPVLDGPSDKDLHTHHKPTHHSALQRSVALQQQLHWTAWLSIYTTRRKMHVRTQDDVAQRMEAAENGTSAQTCEKQQGNGMRGPYVRSMMHVELGSTELGSTELGSTELGSTGFAVLQCCRVVMQLQEAVILTGAVCLPCLSAISLTVLSLMRWGVWSPLFCRAALSGVPKGEYAVR